MNGIPITFRLMVLWFLAMAVILWLCDVLRRIRFVLPKEDRVPPTFFLFLSKAEWCMWLVQLITSPILLFSFQHKDTAIFILLGWVLFGEICYRFFYSRFYF